jgi:UDP-N-acetyl-D-mannosaminuronate dehydrogenase
MSRLARKIVLVTVHDLFKRIDAEYLKKITERGAVVTDSRGMFDKAQLEQNGFH